MNQVQFNSLPQHFPVGLQNQRRYKLNFLLSLFVLHKNYLYHFFHIILTIFLVQTNNL